MIFYIIFFKKGFIFVIAYFITISIPDVAYIGKNLVYFFRLFPTYNVGSGLLNITTTYYRVYISGWKMNYLNWDITGQNICYMAIQVGFLHFIFIYFHLFIY